jgi:predicted nucleic-acid-binding protein
MIGVDASVLMRLAAGDDAAQLRAIHAWIEANAPDEVLFVNRVVLVEVAWTLRTSYGRDEADIALFIDALLGSAAFVVEDEDQVTDALALFENGVAGFPDCLILAGNRKQCSATLTFDRAWRGMEGAVVLATPR